jgi:hypothetical protein
MTQFVAPFDAGDVGEQKTSGLAIGSLVCSLICCVPVTTIPGILLGIAAMVSIGNNPARKGKGIAVAGILLGVIFTAGQAYVYPKLIEFVGESMKLVMGGPADALTAGFANDPVAFKTHFYGTGAQATDAEAQAFIDMLRSRYGEFQGCRFNDQIQTSPAFGQPSTVFPYIMTFDNATVDGEAQIIWVDERTGDMVYKFGWVIVTDPDLGDLRFPVKALGKDADMPTPAPDPATQPAADEMPADEPPATPTGGPDEGDGG